MFKINGKIVSTFRSPFLNKLSDFANVFKAFMGCGYLVMPFAFKRSGLIVSKLYSLSTEVTKPIQMRRGEIARANCKVEEGVSQIRKILQFNEIRKLCQPATFRLGRVKKYQRYRLLDLGDISSLKWHSRGQYIYLLFTYGIIINKTAEFVTEHP